MGFLRLFLRSRRSRRDGRPAFPGSFGGAEAASFETAAPRPFFTRSSKTCPRWSGEGNPHLGGVYLFNKARISSGAFRGRGTGKKIGRGILPRKGQRPLLASDSEAIRSRDLTVIPEQSSRRRRPVTHHLTQKLPHSTGRERRARYLLSLGRRRHRAQAPQPKRSPTLPSHDTPDRPAQPAPPSKHLASMLDVAAAGGPHFAILCLDLDPLKEVNDVLAMRRETPCSAIGPEFGAAARDAFLARLGGDELRACTSAAMTCRRPPEALAERLLDAVTEDSRSRRAACAHRAHDRHRHSSGRRHRASEGRLLANVNAAAFSPRPTAAAPSASSRWRWTRGWRERRALLHELRSALGRGELGLACRPASATSRRRSSASKGAGALADGALGPIPPSTFIPLAEEKHAHPSHRRMILREACPARPRPGSGPCKSPSNLWPVQFRHRNSPAWCIPCFRERPRLAPHRLELEITEACC